MAVDNGGKGTGIEGQRFIVSNATVLAKIVGAENLNIPQRRAVLFSYIDTANWRRYEKIFEHLPVTKRTYMSCRLTQE